jgi:hypothetical protein
VEGTLQGKKGRGTNYQHEVLLRRLKEAQMKGNNHTPERRCYLHAHKRPRSQAKQDFEYDDARTLQIVKVLREL